MTGRGVRWALILMLAVTPVVQGQDSIVARGATRATEPPPPASKSAAHQDASALPGSRVPSTVFGIGEVAEYDVKFGILHVGSGDMQVVDTESIRGHTVWHTQFHIHGGTFFYHVNDTLESWFDVSTLSSLRFVQHLDEGGAKRNRVYDIYPDRQVFVQSGKPEQPSVSAPLDDGSFLYFVRTIPLDSGQTYTFDRYFNPKSNPVTIKVLRRERITVPAGTFNAIVVRPIIKTPGIFSQKGEAEVWISDDSSHVMLQMKSHLSFGSINLYLRRFHPAPALMPPENPAPATPQDSPAGTAAPVP